MVSDLASAVLPSHTETLILGAGPAGLQLGCFLGAAGRDYRILERAATAGAFFERFPRHRTLISINKVYTGYDDPEINMRWDWNSLLGGDPAKRFPAYSREYFPPADEMVRYLEDYARDQALEIRYGVDIVRVARGGPGEPFELTDTEGNLYTAERLVVATGLSEPYTPPIPGIELTESYVDMPTDPEGFAGQRVLVIGKGNSGFETADNLISTAAVIHLASPNPVRMAWRSHFVGHLRAVNNNFLDTYQLKSQNAVLDCTIKRIERRGGHFVLAVSYTHADQETEALVYDRVLCCAGFRFDASIFDDSCRPELVIDDRFPAQTSEWESTNVPDLFFAGTLMQMRDFKKYTSGFIHGFRYNVRTLHHLLESRYQGVAWPRREVEATPAAMTAAIIERVNTTSGLWQQFSMLGDVILFSENAPAVHLEELPLDYVREAPQFGAADYLTINLEFGKNEDDPFTVNRHPQPERAHESFFLHPVVRLHREGRQVAEHHLLEDLDGEWKKEDAHVQPLLGFLSEALAPAMAAG